MGQYNDPTQVIYLQSFLKNWEGFSYVTINGVFDQATHQAVSEFQLRYKSEILTPWGISAPTGYAYIKTIGKINQIICGSAIPAVQKTVYHAPVKVIKDTPPCSCPCTCPAVQGKESAGMYKEGGATSTLSSPSILGQPITDKGQNNSPDDSEHSEVLGASIFSWPDSASETLKCLYELLLILIVLYILGNVLESVLYKDTPENTRKRHMAKWLTMTIGSVLALLGAYLLDEYCLILPLAIAFAASLFYTISKK